MRATICSRRILPTLRYISRRSVDTAPCEWAFTIVPLRLKSRKDCSGSALSHDSILLTRVFEYTDEAIVQQFKQASTLHTERITGLPALFVSERGSGDQKARVGSISRVQVSGKDVNLEYSFDDGIPPIANSSVERLSRELRIDSFEFARTHWAIKEADLFKVLLRSQAATLPSSKVFKLDKADEIDDTLLSVMMPFDPRFDAVYTTIQAAAEASKMPCLRTDDIWENEAIIQDVVSLINRSRIVVCDCTGRNPNVFYEVGIAHTLGRDVILIAQAEADIPFDLRHLRYVTYLNNEEGRGTLADRLRQRIETRLKQRPHRG
jgi:hypothetical protein